MTSESRRPRILICDPIAEAGIAMLCQHADVEIKTGLGKSELLALIGDYEAVVTRSATQITAEVIEHGLRLKVIGRAGAGLDNIDVVAAQQKNIGVVNCPDANTVAVAEHTLGLMLALARDLPHADLSLKAGKWEKSKFMGTGLSGKTLGIIGFGRIGREVAIRAQAFGMKVLVNQRRPTPELNLQAGVEAVDLMELLQRSDFVSLHVPSNAETHGLIGAEQLQLLKPTAYLINTARGTVVDEMALLAALNGGQLAGAALDVFADEPATDNLLAQHARVIATPHIAASTADAQRVAAMTVAEKIIEALRDVERKNPLSLHIVPLDKVFPHELLDPRRVDHLVNRLSIEQKLVNPPIVAEVGDRYVVLDGATRVAAMQRLGYPHIVVQRVPNLDKLGLHTWYHVICQISLTALMKLLRSLPEIVMVKSEPKKILDDMLEYGGVCYVHTVEGQVWLIQPAMGVNRLEALNKLVDTYINGAGHVARTIHRSIATLRQEYPEMAALVVFPEYSVEQVLQIAQAGHALPAGITRFIIPGRVLRLNTPLEQLRSTQSVEEKNEWLYQQVMELLSTGKARYYEEPVYLLDE